MAGGICVALPSIRGFLVTAGRYSPTCRNVVLLRSVLRAADISVLKCSGSRRVLPASTALHRQPQQTRLYPTRIQAECGFCACEESVGPRRWEANGAAAPPGPGRAAEPPSGRAGDRAEEIPLRRALAPPYLGAGPEGGAGSRLPLSLLLPRWPELAASARELCDVSRLCAALPDGSLWNGR